MIDVTEIESFCPDNPDLCGIWHEEEVKEECRDLGIPEGDWLEYILDHLFADYDGWTKEVQAAFLASNVISMKLMVGFYTVTLIKGFNR